MDAAKRTRTERDSMGPVQVPEEAYYGASTMRAVLNFPLSGLRFPRRFIRALGLIKRSAAEANAELGLLEPRLTEAIVRAADEVVQKLKLVGDDPGALFMIDRELAQRVFVAPAAKTE